MREFPTMPLEHSGQGSRMRLAMGPDAEVVLAGTAEMLARVAPEIEVIGLADPSDVPRGVAMVIYDPQRHDLSAFALLDPNSRPTVAVAYCWSTRPDIVDEARRQGAAAFLSKELTAEEVVTALRAVRAGHHGRFLFEPWAPAPAPIASRRPNGLTEREFDVLELITQGDSNDEIAKRLFLSINSVKSYIRTAYRKIGASRRAQAVLWGIEHGLAPRKGHGA